MNQTANATLQVKFVQRTAKLGWVILSGPISRQLAIEHAPRYAPRRWQAEPIAEWSEVLEGWKVPVYLPV